MNMLSVHMRRKIGLIKPSFKLDLEQSLPVSGKNLPVNDSKQQNMSTIDKLKTPQILPTHPIFPVSPTSQGYCINLATPRTPTTPRTPITPPTPVGSNNLMDEIVENLWLGGLLTEKEIIDNKFTHVLSIYDKEPDFINSQNFVTKWINLKDNGSEKIYDYFDECSEFIHNVLLSGGKIYVHCYFGFSRSPAIVIAYIMRYGIKSKNLCKCKFNCALDFVSSKRPSICPNLGFNLSLRNYENKLFIKN